MRMVKGLLWAGIALLLFLPVTVMAGDSWTEGKRLFDDGQYEKAVELLDQAFREHPENLDISFYLGRAAFEAGDYETAAMAYERILFMDPEAKRVKLELARAYLQLGSRDIAREYFRSVQATNPPPAVWQQIQQFIDAIDKAEQRHIFTGFVTIGALYDSNVGTVADTGSIQIGGLEFTLNQQIEEDFGVQASAVLNHAYRFIDTPYVWKNTLTSYNTFYNEEHASDLNYLALNSGIVRQDAKTIWELQALAGQVNLGSDRYLGLLGGNLNHTRLLTRTLQLSVGVAFQDKNYLRSEDNNRDAQNWSLLINPVWNSGPNRLSLSGGYEIEDATSERYDYGRWSAGLRYDRQLPRDFAVYAGAHYRDTDYDGIEFLFQKKRAEQQTVLEAGISKVFWRSADRKQVLAGQLSYSHTDNDANIELYSYEKDQVLSTFTYAF